MDLLTSDLAYDIFIPSTWTGIKMEPYHLNIKPNPPKFLKGRARPVREALYKDAKSKFDRMRTCFYETLT